MFQWENRDVIELPEYIQVSKDIEALGEVPFIEWERKHTKGWRTWTRDSKVWEYPFIYLQLKKMNREGMKVMDFGCGTTPFSAFLHKQGFDVWGVDYKFLGYPGEVTKESLEKAYPEVHYYLGDIKNIPERDFDVIISCSVLEHVLPDSLRIDVLKYLRTLLKSDGKMLHVVDFYFPEKKKREHQRINFSGLAKEMGFNIPDQSICPGSDSFDFNNVRNRINFIRRDSEARVAIGDDIE